MMFSSMVCMNEHETLNMKIRKVLSIMHFLKEIFETVEIMKNGDLLIRVSLILLTRMEQVLLLLHQIQPLTNNSYESKLQMELCMTQQTQFHEVLVFQLIRNLILWSLWIFQMYFQSMQY